MQLVTSHDRIIKEVPRYEDNTIHTAFIPLRSQLLLFLLTL